MSKKRLEYSICFGSISLAAVDSLLNGLKVGSLLDENIPSAIQTEEIFHRWYKETHVFHLRKFQTKSLSLILSPKPEKYIRSNLGRVIPNQRKNITYVSRNISSFLAHFIS